MKKIYSMIAVSAVVGILNCTPESGSSDEENALLALALTAGPTNCDVTSSRGTVTMPLVNVGSDSTATASAVLDDASGKYWTAVRLTGVQNGTTVQFGYDPKYAPGGPGTFIVTYVTNSCPITDQDTNSDPAGDTESDNAASGAGFNATNYSYNDTTKTVTFNATAAGKDFIITTGVDADPAGQSITRTN